LDLKTKLTSTKPTSNEARNPILQNECYK